MGSRSKILMVQAFPASFISEVKAYVNMMKFNYSFNDRKDVFRKALHTMRFPQKA